MSNWSVPSELNWLDRSKQQLKIGADFERAAFYNDRGRAKVSQFNAVPGHLVFVLTNPIQEEDS